MRALSAPGIILYVLTMTFAAVDWIMSINTHFDSTIFGFILIGGQVVSAMSLMIAVTVLLARSEPMSRVVQPRHLHSLGKLLFAFIMLWAYFAFSQFLIIWAGNLPEEIPWYLSRAQGGWAWVALGLIVFHFAVPFLLLLSRFVKRRAQILGWVAAGLIVMSGVDIFWLTVPAFERAGPEFHLTDCLAILGIGGLWLWRFTAQLKGRPLLPPHDSRLKEIMQHG